MKFWTLFIYSMLAFENQTGQFSGKIALFCPESNPTRFKLE
jgi:hypothetical protein